MLKSSGKLPAWPSRARCVPPKIAFGWVDSAAWSECSPPQAGRPPGRHTPSKRAAAASQAMSQTARTGRGSAAGRSSSLEVPSGCPAFLVSRGKRADGLRPVCNSRFLVRILPGALGLRCRAYRIASASRPQWLPTMAQQTPEELIARCICPVKPEFLRRAPPKREAAATENKPSKAKQRQVTPRRHLGWLHPAHRLSGAGC